MIVETARSPGQSVGRLVAAFRLLCAAVCYVNSIADHEFQGFELEPDDLLLLGYMLFALMLLWVALKNWHLSFRLYYPVLVGDFAIMLAGPYALHNDGSESIGASTVLLVFMATALAARRDLRHYRALLVACALASILNAVYFLDVSPALIVHTSLYAIFGILVVHAGVRLSVRHEPPMRFLSGLHEPADSAEPILQIAVEFGQGTCGCLAWVDHEGELPRQCLRIDSKGPCTPGPLLAITKQWPVVLFDVDRRQAIGLNRSGEIEVLQPGKVETLLAAAHSGQGVTFEINGAAGSGVMAVYGLTAIDWGHLWRWEEFAHQATLQLDFVHFNERQRISDLVNSRVAIARDLHDSVAQSLSGTALWLRALASDPQTSEPLGRRIEEVRKAILAEHGEVRRIIRALREGSMDLADIELSRSLGEVSRHLSVQWRMEVNTGGVPLGIRLPYALCQEVKQLLREAVANAARHGQASRITVTAGVAEDILDLQFVDNGVGFANDGNESWPRSLDERAASLGGSIEVGHTGGGNLVAVRLPLESKK